MENIIEKYETFSVTEKKYIDWFWENMERLFEIKPDHSIYINISVFGEDNVEIVESNLTRIFIESHSPFKIADSSDENIVTIFHINELKDEFGKEIPYKHIIEMENHLNKDIKLMEKSIAESLKKIERINKEIKEYEDCDEDLRKLKRLGD